MPELPEVETVRRGLAERVVGRRIDRVEVGRLRSVRRHGPERLVDRLVGRTVMAADRRGKYIVCALDSGDSVMIHLRMSGQLLVHSADTPRPPHAHVNLRLERRDDVGVEELRFVDPRTFGEVVVFSPTDADVLVPELARLGPDPLVDGIDLSDLRRRLTSTRRVAKALLLDQSVIAGIGNIYGDEILHRAGVHPRRPANRIGSAASERLHRAIGDVLVAAVAAGGSTLGDAQYVDVAGRSGSFQQSHRVYGRTGELCPTCGRGRVRSAVVAGRTSHWCGVCQR